MKKNAPKLVYHEGLLMYWRDQIGLEKRPNEE